MSIRIESYETHLIYGLHSYSQFAHHRTFHLFDRPIFRLGNVKEFLSSRVQPFNASSLCTSFPFKHSKTDYSQALKRESLNERLLSSVDCSFLLTLSFPVPFLIWSVLLLLTRSILLFSFFFLLFIVCLQLLPNRSLLMKLIPRLLKSIKHIIS